MRKDVWQVNVRHDQLFGAKTNSEIIVMTKQRIEKMPDAEAAAKKAHAVIRRRRNMYRSGEIVSITRLGYISE